MGFPGDSDGKESAYNVGDLGLIPGLGRSPEERNGYSLQYSGLQNSMDLCPDPDRNLTDYSRWGCKESDGLSDFQKKKKLIQIYYTS